MTIVEANAGTATLTMPFFIDYAQGAGLMHGGALVSLADTAVAMAIKSIVEPFAFFATIEMESRFVRPVKKGVITARARVVSRDGKRLKGEAILYDQDQREVMRFWSTFKFSREARDNEGKGPHNSEITPGPT
jgi:uncharacterized protein (TIGR00369 family)